MKLHRLEITAFGPFAGHETVDFEELNRAGVFLLNGETGAGKTSVLDAICFALYSTAPTVASQGGRKPVHSDHADPYTAPLVDLEFSAGGRRWHVSRAPAWSKPSARAASGWSEQHARVLLRELVDGTWVERAHRPDEVGQWVEHVVGLNREQFTQVMMLPQGRFAQFLKAGSKEREQLLETLFGTDVYPRIQRELKDLSTRAQAELLAVRAGREHDQQRVMHLGEQLRHAVADLPPGTCTLPHDVAAQDPAGDDRTDPAERSDQLSPQGLAAATTSVAGELQTARERITSRQRDAADRWAVLSQRQRSVQRLERLTHELTDLDAQAEDFRERRAQLATHRAAQSLHGPLQDVRAAEDSATMLAATARRAMAALTEPSEDHHRFVLALGDALPALRDAVREPSKLADLHDAAVAARADAEQAGDHSEAVTDARTRLEELSAHLADLRVRGATITQELDELARREAASRQTLSELERETRDAPVVRERAERADDVLAASRRYRDLAHQRDQRGEELERAEQQRRHAVTHVEDLESQRFASAAATLAGTLQPDHPCPVCGSTQHPAPAERHHGQEVTEAALRTARSARDEAQELADRAHALWRAAQQSASGALGEGATEDLEAAQRHADEARAALTRVERALAEQTRVTTTLDTQARDITALREQQRRFELDEETTRTRHDDMAARLVDLEARLEKELRGFESVEQRVLAVTDLMTAVNTAETTHREVEQGTRKLEYCRASLSTALEESPFDTVEQVRDALLDAAREDSLTRWCDQYEQRGGAVRAELATEEMVATDSLTPQQRDEATPEAVEAAAEITQDLTQQRDHLISVTGTLTALERTVQHVLRDAQERQDVLVRVMEHAQRLAGLADVANGTSSDNTLRMTLTSFVLAAKLEQVATVASEHLQHMSSGRYSLRHTDQVRGGGKAGLGLEIDDSWTGARRGTETLSGGESFFTSLALALALADVVQAQAGGQEMDTLFVDEGFGSLDEDTLEHVLETIDGLRRNGRVIGLVSHVAEMKQRIGTQLVVTKTPRGSHLEVQSALDVTA